MFRLKLTRLYVDGVVIRSGHSNLDIDDLIARNFKRSSPTDSGSSSSGSGSSNLGSNYFGGGGGSGSGSAYTNGGGFITGPHFDVLFGVVTGESIWRFSAHDIQNGFEGERRDKIIRTYVRNAYNYHLNEIFYTLLCRSWHTYACLRPNREQSRSLRANKKEFGISSKFCQKSNDLLDNLLAAGGTTLNQRPEILQPLEDNGSTVAFKMNDQMHTWLYIVISH
uniref:Uncharacterized protein n=1 Tax=Glossina morsitans morsitans TaxID=37546 RepID=A0A1B0GDW1_GLOMM